MLPRRVEVLAALAWALWSAVAHCEASGGAVKLPDDFIVGSGTSSYQAEGAWNVSGKGENLLDRVLHSSDYAGLPNADVGADSYHRSKDDLAAIRELKLQMYRFSLSWPRLLPNGWTSNVNQDGLRYYHQLLDDLLDSGIQPMVTLFHWDAPQALLDEFDGWNNDKMVDAFVAYADFAFTHFGDRVRYWTTHNEPYVFCNFFPNTGPFLAGEMTQDTMPTPAPGHEGDDYKCLQRIVLSHGRVYRLYQEKYAATQHGLIGLSNFAYAPRPNSSSFADVAAVRRYNLLTLGTTFGPLVTGDYPVEVRRMVDEASEREGLGKSRLPEFSADQRAMLRGTIDFLGVNNYFGQTIAAAKRPERGSALTDAAVQVVANDVFGANVATESSQMTPWSLKEAALWCWDEYRVPIFVTENGFMTETSVVSLDDNIRAVYHSAYMRELVRSIEDDGVRVLGYLAWSLLDLYEWVRQYKYSYGLVHVDYAGGSLNRTLKKSSAFFKEVGETRTIPEVAASSACFSSSLLPVLAGLIVLKCL
ncbi:myrosinase 1-like [Thrips palmi]|uniref:Myrosinase 1-like n=1 Tax=Thrips palmi TaxID=161013 RepID=A0A6P8YWX3_THRPL|nr:myrosinase 1-like [Thrips palmi]